MVKKHIKRISAPKSWPILRKERTWVTRPYPGKPFKLALSVSNVLKELTGTARTSKEARYLLQHVGVELNGSPVHKARRPVGFMDVLSIPSQKQFWRIGITKKGRLCAVEIDDKQSTKRIVKIKNKTRVGNKIQINCTDGTNILVDKNQYSTGDSLLLEDNKVSKHLPLEKGARIILTSGSHLSQVGVVTDVVDKTIFFESESETYTTATRFAFVIGKDKDEVSVR